MSFPLRFIQLRKQQGLSQQAMADAIGIHITQVKRYEAGTAQPSLDMLKKIALAFSVTTDALQLPPQAIVPWLQLKRALVGAGGV